MTLSRRSANVLVASALTLAVIGAGIFGYSAKIQADTITPGFATAKVIMEITVPEQTELSVNATFTPTDARIKRYYFKNRVFVLKPGINLVNWYIKKIPGGDYDSSIKSNVASFEPSGSALTLQSDQIIDTDKFIINLGMPTVSSEEQTAEPTAAAQDTSTNTNPNSPITPSLDASPTNNNPTASATATERVPDENIPSIPTLPT